MGWITLSAGPLLALFWHVGLSTTLAEPSRQWPVYGGDFTGSKHSVLDQINRANVHQLQPAWVLRLDDVQGPGSTIECNPLVVHGVMYLTSPGLKVQCQQ